MNILMVLEKEFPPDERVEKEAYSLALAGNKVIIACYTFMDKPLTEDFDYFKVIRKPVSRLIYKSSIAILLIPFYFRFWEKYLDRIIKDEKIDILHVHDLPLSKTGYKLCKKYGLKLVCDQHEYYSNWIIYTAHYNTLVGKIIKHLSNWKKYEKKYLKRADLVITIEEPLRLAYIEKVKVNPDKIIIVPNTPLKRIFNTDNIKKEIQENYKNDYVLFYAGGIDILRGIDMVIDALPLIKEKIPNIKFVLAGKIQKGFNLSDYAKKRNVDELVSLIGWIDTDDLPSYMLAGKVCVFTPPVNRDEINKTIVTKIYQYASVGRPILVSRAQLMKEFVENNELGFSVSNCREFADKVIYLHNNPLVYDKISNNCLRISKKYHWELTSNQLIKFYKTKLGK
ncbi:MAG: glycosyltransferase [Bacteroidales bacterium]|nr:MAG: glycosyltransferase [Bacteroidales bacterium]